MFLITLAISLILSLWAPLVLAGGQDSLARAKELYSAAAYDEALALLDDLQAGSNGSGSTTTEVSQYRAFCLLALQRTDDAKKVIEGMVSVDPFYRLSDAQASPRVTSIFQEVRRAVLPGVVQRAYTEAKQAFDKKDPRSSAQFEHVLALIDDPDMRNASSPDFRTLVVGFHDLSRALASAAAQPPPPVVVAPPVVAPQAPAVDLAVTSGTSAAAPASPASPAIARPVVIVPPVVLAQPMPRWIPRTISDAARVLTGRLEISIDERGNVVSAVLAAPIYPSYDEELLTMARAWRFKPATQNGTPIPFVKVIQIQLQQRR